MPVRGLILVLFLILAAVAGYFFLIGGGGNETTPSVVSKDITTKGDGPVSEVGSPEPTFDIVRVDRTGEAVIAGRALPGAIVTILSNGRQIGRATAEADGSWVVVIEQPLAVGTQEIALSAKLGDGEPVLSQQRVVVDVPDRRDSLPLVVLGDPSGASRVLQRPEAMGEPGKLSVEVVDYDRSGGVVISGRAAPGAIVRIYLDNDPVGDAVADADGVWTHRPQDVAAGAYILRVDELGSKAQVTARIEVPFERADPEVAAKSLLRQGGRVIVQPGNSLWRIAREIYGEGFQYTVIYQANMEQIRDPDLIYPGQIFAVPEEPQG